MNTITFEATVTAEHQLHCELPVALPVGSRVRITVEAVGESENVRPPSELGRTLWTIRQRAIAKGMKLQALDEILEEIRHDRGEAGNDQNLS